MDVRGVLGLRAAAERVERALAALAAGRPVLVVDDADREDEGDLVLAADTATRESVAFVLRHSSGVLCVALTAERCDALALAPMVAPGTDPGGGDPHGTAFTVSVDARAGTTTGISAADRATTVRLLADPAAAPADLRRPGHVFPLRAREGGVLTRRGHTEAAVDLCRLAGRAPAGLICEVVSPDHADMADGAQLRALATEHDIPQLSVADVVAYRREAAPVRREASTRLPTRHGVFTAHGYRGADGREHLALVLGDPDGGPVRLHRECLAGDPFGVPGPVAAEWVPRCDCRARLDAAQAAIVAAGHGALVYLRSDPGMPRALGRALRHLPAAPGVDDLVAGTAVLHDLGVRRIHLLPGDPTDPVALAAFGIVVVPATAPASPSRVAG